MGYRASWCAVKNGDLPTALQTLGLIKTRESSEPVYDPGLYALSMPEGWLVVVGSGSPFIDAVRPEHAQALSTSGEALHFYCNDTGMYASLCAFRAGREVWSLDYDGGNAGTPIVSGEAPNVVTDVLQACLSAQREATDGDHVYDAAPQIGFELVRFRHDQTLSDRSHGPTSILEIAETEMRPKQSWIRKLFGFYK